MWLRTIFPVAVLFLAILTAGCSKGPHVVKVAGSVTRGGQAVPGLTVHFVPDEGRASFGRTDDVGAFVLQYTRDQGGATAGHNRVWVEFRMTPAEEKAAMEGKYAPFKDQDVILLKYGNRENPQLEFDIQKDTPNLEIKLD